VAPLYLSTVLASLKQAGFAPCSHVYPAGEASKTLATLAELLEFLAAEHLTRTDCVVALGGGVTGDMAGFAAAVYLRGVRCVQLPTTLLAAVDSSVGGKTAVDLQAGKNLAGAFLQPAAVLCDTDCLSSLPPSALADGAAEAVKTGILSGEALFSRLENGSWRGDLPEIIAQCVAYKGRIVGEDPLEGGVRKLLNLGHTAAHAIEKLSGFTVSHGRAVAMGTALIARASERLGWCTQPCARRIEATLASCNLPTKTDYAAADLARAALSDKKRAGDTLTLAVPEAIGRCVLRPVPVETLSDVFAAGLEA
jgi:3-dehydroquinate synthase